MAIEEISDTTWTSSTVNSQTVKTSATSQTLSGATNSLVSGDITDALSGKKVIVSINVTGAFSDVVATLIIEGSMDGTNWGSISTINLDTTPNVTGHKVAIANLADHTSIPKFRFHFNPTALSVGTSGQCVFIYAYTA